MISDLHIIYPIRYISWNMANLEHGTADDVILNPKEAYTKRLISDVPKIHEEWNLDTVVLMREKIKI